MSPCFAPRSGWKDPRCFIELSYTTGSYQLDNGGGHQPFSDLSQTLTVFRTLTNGVHVVAAKGKTEFGPFVSVGYLDPAPEAGPVLTLVRRYLDEDDWRSIFGQRWGTYAVDKFTEAKEEWSAPGGELRRRFYGILKCNADTSERMEPYSPLNRFSPLASLVAIAFSSQPLEDTSLGLYPRMTHLSPLNLLRSIG